MVSKIGHELCRQHWGGKSKLLPQIDIKTDEQPKRLPDYLTATELGEVFNLSNRKINKILSDIGWIKSTDSGWIATEQGQKLKVQTESGIGKKTYIKWPSGITKSSVLKRAITEYLNPAIEQQQPMEVVDEFRGKFPGTIRTTDGHFVRSRAEAMIDNWLYMNEILHIYEKSLPIEELLISDFFIPAGNVYIEFWGLENDPKYLKRKERKLEIYKENNFNLIELKDVHLNNLDDHLPKMLRKFSVIVD